MISPDQYRLDFEKVVDHFKQDISRLRTGRATPALVEDIVIDAYGTKQPLKSLASISVSDPKTLAVEPWDKSILQAIEAGIRMAPIGINPVNDGRLIRLPLPDLTQERRVELIKVLDQKAEQARISARKIREDARDFAEKQEEDKAISEDEKFKFFDQLEKLVKDYNEKIKVIAEEKEKEIITI